MSERPTPETNAFGGNQEAWIKFAEKLERERDEARAEAKRLDGAYEDATNYYARIIELIDERDEAMAVANELADIASHCLGWHDHESGETAEKITNALKRWRNLQNK